jgi:fluoroquinolone transport system permease protein
MLLHPGVCIIELCDNGVYALPALAILIVWTALAALIACRVVQKSLRSLGGVKL